MRALVEEGAIAVLAGATGLANLGRDECTFDREAHATII